MKGVCIVTVMEEETHMCGHGIPHPPVRPASLPFCQVCGVARSPFTELWLPSKISGLKDSCFCCSLVGFDMGMMLLLHWLKQQGVSAETFYDSEYSFIGHL